VLGIIPHIDSTQLAQQLQISPEVVRNICQSLSLSVKANDTVDETVEQQLVQLKEVANREGISLEEAAQHLIEIRDRTSTPETEEHRFNKREYIKQRYYKTRKVPKIEEMHHVR
jgi:hypothetical protein